MDEQIREEQAVEEPTSEEQAVEGDTMKSRGRKREELDAAEQPTDAQPANEQPADAQPTGRKTRRKINPQEDDPQEVIHRMIMIPRCPEDRDYCPSCAAYRDGKCAALADFTFSDSRHDRHGRHDRCPFYKEKEKAREERLAAMEKLEDTENRRLIRKCYGGPNKFNWIFGNELVGISYDFDDDGYEYIAEEEAKEPITASDADTASDTSMASGTITEMEESK